MSPVDATLDGNYVQLYLLNGQENVVTFDDHLYNFRLQSPELASMSVRHLTPASLSKISLNVRSLCTGLISTLLSVAWFMQNCTFTISIWNQDKAIAPFRCLIHTQGLYYMLLLVSLAPL